MLQESSVTTLVVYLQLHSDREKQILCVLGVPLHDDTTSWLWYDAECIEQ
jgi:hypothetical protein